MSTSTLANERGAPSSQVLVAFCFLACGSFQLVVGRLFGVSKSTMYRTIQSSCCVLPTDAAIRSLPPRQQCETGAMKTAFQAVANFPNVIGCVDCTHIKITAPIVNEHEYVHRKNDHTINVQLICDHDALIMNCLWKKQQIVISSVFPCHEKCNIHFTMEPKRYH